MFKRREREFEEEGYGLRTVPLPSERPAPARVTPLRSPLQAYPQLAEEQEEPFWQEQPAERTLPEEAPEAILAEGIHVTGQLKFNRYLRIDGEFEGEIISEGKIVVGPTGVVRSNLELREAIIEGRVEGNVVASERVELRGEAQVFGDVETRLLAVDEGVTLVGRVTVHPSPDPR